MVTKNRFQVRPLDADSYTPIYVQLKESLLAFIQSKDSCIGEKIPSINELKELYKASDTPCRKAIAELMYEGVLEGKQGKGVFIRSKFPSTAVKEITLLALHGPETLRHPAFSEVVNGIMQDIGRRSMHLSFTFIDPILMSTEELRRRISQIKGSGVIIPLIPGLTDRMLLPLLDARVPVVFITERFNEISPYLVKWDVKSMVRRTAKKMLARGKRKICLLGCPWDNTVYTDIHAGIAEAFEKEHLTFGAEYVRRGPYSAETGRNSMRNLFSEGLKPDVVIANDDMVAKGAIEYLNQRKIPVPEQIEVLAIGGFLNYLPYELSSIRMPFFEVGQRAADMMLKLVEGKIPERSEILVPCSLKQGHTMLFNHAKGGGKWIRRKSLEKALR